MKFKASKFLVSVAFLGLVFFILSSLFFHTTEVLAAASSVPQFEIQLGETNTTNSSVNHPGDCGNNLSIPTWGTSVSTGNGHDADCIRIRFVPGTEGDYYTQDFQVCFSITGRNGQTSGCSPWASTGGGATSQIASSSGQFSSASISVNTRSAPGGEYYTNVDGIVVLYYKSSSDANCGAGGGGWARTSTPNTWGYSQSSDDDPGCAQAGFSVVANAPFNAQFVRSEVPSATQTSANTFTVSANNSYPAKFVMHNTGSPWNSDAVTTSGDCSTWAPTAEGQTCQETKTYHSTDIVLAKIDSVLSSQVSAPNEINYSKIVHYTYTAVAYTVDPGDPPPPPPDSDPCNGRVCPLLNKLDKSSWLDRFLSELFPKIAFAVIGDGEGGGGGFCGDSICGVDEDSFSCPGDCGGGGGFCGDATCGAGETTSSCPSDCGSAPFCGDSICNNSETSGSCPGDCPVTPFCGDSICNNGETTSSCSTDCGSGGSGGTGLAIVVTQDGTSDVFTDPETGFPFSLTVGNSSGQFILQYKMKKKSGPCSANGLDASCLFGNTATLTTNVTGGAAPDLTASAPTPSAAVAGTAQTYTATISNIGNASTGASFPYFFQKATLPNGGGTITDQTFSTMATLANGANATATSPSITFSADGSVRVCADKSNSASTGTITESNETNNCSAWTIVTVSAVINGACGASSGSTPQNPEPTGASACSAGILNSTSPADTSLAWNWSCTGSNGGTSPSCSAPKYGCTTSTDTNYNPSGPNNTYGCSLVCSNGATNYPTCTPSRPDLTASAPTPSAAIAGTAQTYTSTISNIGTASASGTITHLFQYDDDADHISGVTATGIDTTTSTIASGSGTATVTNSHTFTAGTRYVRVCADNNVSFVGTVTESNETNNCSAWTIVTVSAVINGACGASSGSTPQNPEPTGASACSAGILNSTSPADTSLAWNWSCTGSNGGTSPSCSAPKYGCTTSTDTNYNPSGPNNTYGCSLVCSNGATNYPTCTPSRPDLTAGAVTPTSASTGVAKTYTATISNSNAPTGVSFPYFFQTCNVGGGCVSPTDKTSSTMAALGAPGSATATSPSISLSPSGTYSIRVCADKTSSVGGGVITESDEGNNCGPWTDVAVKAGMSGSLSASPNPCTITAGNSSCTTTLSWNVSSPENVLDSGVTSNVDNSGASSPNFHVVYPPSPTPTTGTFDAGTKTLVTIPYLIGGIHTSRTFYLYNNAKSLVPTAPNGSGIGVTANCTSSTSWDGIKCSSSGPFVNGVCATPPNGQSYSSASDIEFPLCTQGTASTSSFSGNGPWHWSCNGSGGGASPDCTATQIPPSCSSITANPTSIYQGASTTLTWSSCADSCTGTKFTPPAPGKSGSQNVSPPSTTTYRIDCPSGTPTSSATVKVIVKKKPFFIED